ncbi:hypothetical protein BH23CHL4_BH23CHL4_25790 [soil metagenome]
MKAQTTILDNPASAQGRSEEAPNIELARETAAGNDWKGSHTATKNASEVSTGIGLWSSSSPST